MFFGIMTNAQTTPKLKIGMNVPSTNYYTSALIYTDIKKSSSEFMSYTLGGSDWDSGLLDSIPVDSCGYPLQIPYNVTGHGNQGVRFLLNSTYNGKYVFLSDGDGDFEISFDYEIVNGKKILNFIGEAQHYWINITRSNPANPIRNIRIIPLAYENNPDATPLFEEKFIEGLKPFYCLRFMDFNQTNNSPLKTWNERPKAYTHTQGNETLGSCYENACQMANQLNVDAWFCIPHMANDDFIRKMAQLIKTKLKPSLKCYIEYSNELWNWGFAQSGWAVNNGISYHWHNDGSQTPDSSTIALDHYVIEALKAIGPAGSEYPDKDAFLMNRAFKIFSEEFAGQTNRLVRVAGVQQAWVGHTERILDYIYNKLGGSCDMVSPGGYFGFETDQWDDILIPKTVIPWVVNTDLNEYFHKLWMQDPTNVTAEDIIAAAGTILNHQSGYRIRETARIAKKYGVGYAVYEGGQHMPPHLAQDWPYNQAVYDAQIHSGMYDLYMKNFAIHEEIGCDLFMAFSYIGPRENRYGSWGHLESIGQLDSINLMNIAPKYKALIDANIPKNNTNISVTNKNETGIVIFPNPSNGDINIVLENEQKIPANISIIDITGRILVNKNLNYPTKIIKFTIPESIDNGIYIVSMQIGKTYFSQKLILTR